MAGPASKVEARYDAHAQTEWDRPGDRRMEYAVTLRAMDEHLLALSALLACAAPARRPAEPASPPALAVIATRDHRVVVHAGEGAPRYTVLDAQGRVLAREIDAAVLARDWPALRRAVESGVAGAGPVAADL